MSTIKGTRGWAAVAGNYVFGLTWDWTINDITAANGKKVYCPFALLIELPGDEGAGMVGISVLWFLVFVLWRKIMTPETNLPPSETNLNAVCETCHHPSHEGRACGQLCMWDRPGGVPGNGHCHCGAAAQASTLTTTNQAATFFVPLDELPELPACAAINANGVIFAGRRHADCLKMAVRIGSRVLHAGHDGIYDYSRTLGEPR